jgi:molybdopterin converting factor small subunit
MRVSVSYVGLLPGIAGTRHEVVELDHERPTLADLLSILGDRHGSALQEVLLEAREERSRLAAVLVNGQRCGNFDVALSGGQSVDVVLFGPPPQGG